MRLTGDGPADPARANAAPAIAPLPLRVVVAAQLLAAVGVFGLFFPLGLTAGAAAVIGVSHGSGLGFAAALGLASFSVTPPTLTLLSLFAALGLDRRRWWGWLAGLAVAVLLLASIALRLAVGDEPSFSDDVDPRSLLLTMIPNLITPSGMAEDSMIVGGIVAVAVLLALLTTWRLRDSWPSATRSATSVERPRRPRRIAILAILLAITGIDALVALVVWLAGGFTSDTVETGVVIGLASAVAAGLALTTAVGAYRLDRISVTFGPGVALTVGIWVTFWMSMVALLAMTSALEIAALPPVAAIAVTVVTIPFAIWSLLTSRATFDPATATVRAWAAGEPVSDAGLAEAFTAVRGHWRLVAAGAAVIGIAVVVWFAVAVVSGPSGPLAGPVVGTTEPIDEAPLVPRLSPGVIWTGDELIVWGGMNPPDASEASFRALADGAAYDPATATWSMLPAAPIRGRASAVIVATGSELIVWGGSGADGLLSDGAAFDLTTRTWRPIAAAPLSPRANAASVWTGAELVIFGGETAVSKETPAATADGAAYDPGSDTWRLLPSPPVPVSWYNHLVWTGHEVILLADSPMDDAGPPVQVAAWDPTTGTWRIPPAPPPVGLLNAALPPLWTGDRILTVAPHIFETQHDPGTDPSTVPLPAGAYDPTLGTWEPAPYPPYELDYAAPVVWTGSEAWLPGADRGSIAAYDPVTGTWRTFRVELGSPRFLPSIFWAGDRLLIWGGQEAGEATVSPHMDGVIYIPPDLAADGT